MTPGDPYTDQFDRAAAAATAWFTEHLRPEGER